MSDERETALREAIDRAEHALAACDTTRSDGDGAIPWLTSASSAS